MKRLGLSLTLTLLVALGLTACSTPESRIRKNPELFDSLAADVQEKIRAGEVDIGFTKPMVEIALDKPDRSYRRRTEEGQAEVWSYVDVRLNYEQQRVRGTFTVRDKDGRLHTVHDDAWVTVQHKTEVESIRIEFNEQGTVRAIENVEQ